jgi:AbiA family abortive infection protein
MNVFSLEYDDWKTVCSQILAQKSGRKRMYLQWYPFYKLSSTDKNMILSEDYFNEFIKNGLFLYYPETWLVCDNYILKGDGSFRNAALSSPLLYLLALTMGKKISKNYPQQRPADILVHYGGNYNENRFFYKEDYDVFVKTISNLSQSYMYFLKTDIKDYYSNIDINKLFSMINSNTNQISQKEIMLYKELLRFLGQGEFPLIENSLVSSYLSTVIYLEEPDSKLFWYLENKENDISNFLMIRYVDDLYILFNTCLDYQNIISLVNRITNYYSSELKKLNLNLNRGKTSVRAVGELDKELKKSLYDDYLGRKNFKIDNLVDTNMGIKFLEELKISLEEYDLDVNKYNEIIKDSFYIENTTFMAEEIFNIMIYREHPLFAGKEFVDKLLALIKNDYNFLKFDPKRLVIMVTKTKSQTLIKIFLSKLFESARNETWDVYDTSLAVNYLLQRGFNHQDLLTIIKKEEKYIYKYYELFCRSSFLDAYKKSRNGYIKTFNDRLFYKKDNILFFLYFMYKIELKKHNYLSAFAFFKNFFDRISAHLAYFILNDKARGKPNYRKYYTDGVLKSLYCGIKDSESVIGRAHKIRNANPISHSSSELLDNINTDRDILQSINDLNLLISTKIGV